MKKDTKDRQYLINLFKSIYLDKVSFMPSFFPQKLVNKFHHLNMGEYLYADIPEDKNITNVKEWTTNELVAKRNAKTYPNSKIIKIEKSEFIKYFDFISMDMLYEHLTKLKADIKYYRSEQEIYVINEK